METPHLQARHSWSISECFDALLQPCPAKQLGSGNQFPCSPHAALEMKSSVLWAFVIVSTAELYSRSDERDIFRTPHHINSNGVVCVHSNGEFATL